MTMIKIHLCPDNLRRETFTTPDLSSFARDNFPLYTRTNWFTLPQEGEEAAEEAFDLTNNSARDKERSDVYGPHRPVSVGDVVECLHRDRSKQFYLCESVGWSLLAGPFES